MDIDELENLAQRVEVAKHQVCKPVSCIPAYGILLQQDFASTDFVTYTCNCWLSDCTIQQYTSLFMSMVIILGPCLIAIHSCIKGYACCLHSVSNTDHTSQNKIAAHKAQMSHVKCLSQTDSITRFPSFRVYGRTHWPSPEIHVTSYTRCSGCKHCVCF